MAIGQSRQETVGYFELIQENRDFRFLWLGQIASLLGDWFNLIASAALIAQLSQSGFAIGSLFAVRMLAPFLVSPIAGVVSDRYSRKMILIATDIGRASVVLGFLLVRDSGDIWLLYVLTAFQMALSGFFFPTRNAILPDLVSSRELGTANALSSVTWSAMLALGAGLGGLVAGSWGLHPAFILDSLTFLVSAGCIFQVRPRRGSDRQDSERGLSAALGEYFDGLRYLGHHLDLLVVSLQKAASALFISSGFQVVQVAIAEEIFVLGQGGGTGLGLMFAAAGVGTGIGPIVIRRFTGDRFKPMCWAIVLGFVSSTLGLLATAPLSSFNSVLFGTFLRGVGGGTIWVFSTQLLLQLSSKRVRGRVFSTEFAFFSLSSAAAVTTFGTILDSGLGISGTIWWMLGLSFIPSLLWMSWILFSGLSERQVDLQGRAKVLPYTSEREVSP